MRLAALPVEGFLAELASEAPAPGGGSAAALAGAAAASLCAMVARITLGREKLHDRWPAMEEVLREAEAAAKRLIALIDEDSAAYAAVVAARRLPKSTEAERTARDRAALAANRRATAAPLETLALAAEVAGLAARAASLGHPACITDAGSAAVLARAAAVSAAANVRVNLPSLPDGAERDRLGRRADECLAAAQAAADGAERAVGEGLGGGR